MAKANKKSAKEASNTFHNIMAASVKGNPKPKNKMKFKIGDTVLYNNDHTHYKIIATRENKGNFLLPDGFDYLLLNTDNQKHKVAFEEDICLMP